MILNTMNEVYYENSHLVVSLTARTFEYLCLAALCNERMLPQLSIVLCRSNFKVILLPLCHSGALSG